MTPPRVWAWALRRSMHPCTSKTGSVRFVPRYRPQHSCAKAAVRDGSCPSQRFRVPAALGVRGQRCDAHGCCGCGLLYGRKGAADLTLRVWHIKARHAAFVLVRVHLLRTEDTARPPRLCDGVRAPRQHQRPTCPELASRELPAAQCTSHGPRTSPPVRTRGRSRCSPPAQLRVPRAPRHQH